MNDNDKCECGCGVSANPLQMGAMAFNNGQPLASCPWFLSKDSDKSNLWVEGWREAWGMARARALADNAEESYLNRLGRLPAPDQHSTALSMMMALVDRLDDDEASALLSSAIRIAQDRVKADIRNGI